MNPALVLAAGVLVLAVAGCANSPEPNKYQFLASSPQLTRNGGSEPRQTPYAFQAEGAPLSRFSGVHLLPVSIYDGADHQFGPLSAEDKARLAAFAQQQFREALARNGLLAEAPGPGVVELKVTLTGAQASVPVLATASKLTPVGFALTGVNAVTGAEGRFNGVVMYAVEFRDAPSRQIVWAYVTKQFPNAMNIAATLDPLDAARDGLKQGAEDLAKAAAGRMKAG
ncbi:DUF3313 domain-containing protein [Xanthobacter sp. AM11]|uniref:DUF3313 domain-containing protein n=1 Tax=Xanthobacter sp. AM11 TaxID=3380643 RepID=UPI0039BF69F4